MRSLGMLALGIFIGWITSYGLIHVHDWQNPANVFSAVISAAVAGAIFSFIQFLGGKALGDALFMYPLGLAYGALLNSLSYIGYAEKITLQRGLHLFAVVFASALLLLLLFHEPTRRRVRAFDYPPATADLKPDALPGRQSDPQQPQQ